MELMRAGYRAIFFMIVLFSAFSIPVSSSGSSHELSFANANDAPEISQSPAPTHHERIRCRKKMTYSVKYLVEDSVGCAPQDFATYAKLKILRWKRIQAVISGLPTQRKRELLNCLRNQNRQRGLFAKEHVIEYQFVDCFNLVSAWPTSPRRCLDSESSHQETESSLVLSTATTPKASSTVKFTSFKPPGSQEVVFIHETKHVDREKGSSPSPPEQDSTTDSSDQTPTHKTKNNNNIKKKIKEKKKKYAEQPVTLVAIVATATATFCLIGMLVCCCCCLRSRKNGSTNKRDSRPLLHLSDLSPTSSQNSPNLGNSSSKDGFNGRASIKGAMSMKHRSHDPRFSESLAGISATGEAVQHLKPPPGRAVNPQTSPEPPAAPSAPPPAAPQPPPPPKPRPPAPPPKGKFRSSPLGPPQPPKGGMGQDKEAGSNKTKLKPFFWEKVMANPDHSMVWNEIRDGSFQFNEEMMESLFGYNAAQGKNDKRDPSDPSQQYIQIIDRRKAQNLSILLKALNVTTKEVVDAIQEGNELPVELLQTLLKMTPTQEEELKLRLFAGDVSQLGPAERFLKVLIEIPFVFKRIEALLYMISFQEEASNLKECFATLEVASEKLKNSRLFLKLLEAVLKTGNRMNDGTYRGGAHAFKLDTLLKLSDVKGTDGKTTLLHFVVVEIIRSEGIRAHRKARTNSNVPSVKSEDTGEDSDHATSEHYRTIGLQVVSGLSGELEDVKRAAVIDVDILTTTLSKLRQSLVKTKAFIESDMKNLEEESEFQVAISDFLKRAESDLSWLTEEEKKIMGSVKKTADYFHGNAGKDEGQRLFVIVRDFLVMLDKVCKEVKDDRATNMKMRTKKDSTTKTASHNRQKSDEVRHKKLFPAIAGRRIESSSSDDDSS